MPSTITHAYFTKDVYSKLKKVDKKLDDNHIKRLTTFGQSSDPLMFYKMGILYSGKKIRNFHLYFHTHDTRKFFINLCNIIKDNNLKDNKEVISFLYGFICHYVLDSNIHPYVIYKSGWFDKNNKDSYKYNRYHEYMETYIDNIFIRERENINPYLYKLNKIIDITKFSDELNDVIDKIFNTTFGINNMSKKYYKSLKDMLLFTNLFRRDKYGIKKSLYSIIDSITNEKTFPLKVLSYHTNLNNDKYIFNTDHKTWYNPIKSSIKSNNSFYELYDKCIIEAVNIIHNVNKYLNNEKINLNKVFTNKSYLSGLDCSIKLNFKYFSF